MLMSSTQLQQYNVPGSKFSNNIKSSSSVLHDTVLDYVDAASQL